ncbi:hypothetical protein DsansV1_C07g0068471 [Dioscorea sansibarensis]
MISVHSISRKRYRPMSDCPHLQYISINAFETQRSSLNPHLIAQHCIPIPSLTSANLPHAGITVAKITESSPNPSNLILLNKLKASDHSPCCMVPQIILLHDTKSLSGISSNKIRFHKSYYSMTPNLSQAFLQTKSGHHPNTRIWQTYQ